jgi:predicted metal-dependent HD superfamily phosphohydrolase
MDLGAASEYIIGRLQNELPPSLTYHSKEHTLDVIEATRLLAGMEKIGQADQTILETSALYHDAGMLIRYKDHELTSASLARETLPGFSYSQSEIDEVVRLIMVTRLPQRPYNHLEQVMCDADLDYLGRDDFFIHSFKLRLEWEVFGILQTTLAGWLDIQIGFLTEHRYFTGSAISLRQEKKLRNLEEVKSLLHRKS